MSAIYTYNVQRPFPETSQINKNTGISEGPDADAR